MALTPGTRLGAYEIVAPIGEGGMGAVYRARDTRLDRAVAIKVLSEAIAEDSEFRRRFEREAKTVAALKHPNICTVYDVGQADGLDYLVMEHLEGETVASRLRRGPLPLDDALAIAVAMAGALDAAHRLGIVHRDVKPGNIMLAPDGARLLDFGLAKAKRPAAGDGADELAEAMTRSASLTTDGAILGTTPYLAPEQIEGRPVDARTDIFALGATLYEMAMGRRPFDAPTSAGLMAKILEAQPEPISLPSGGTPPLLRSIVSKCLAKDPDQRWQSARDLHDADARSLNLQNGRILSIADDGEMALLVGPQNIQQAQGSRTLVRVPLTGGAARELLDQVVDADWIPGTGELAAVVRRDGESVLEVPLGSPVHRAQAIWSVRVSPDGRQVAFFEGPVMFGSQPVGAVKLLDETGTVRTLSAGWAGLGLAWSPDGNEVWFTATDGPYAPALHAVTLEGEHRLVDRLPDWMVLHDIGPDGRVLVARNSIRITTQCLPEGGAAERDLGWLVSSDLADLSVDGETVIFADMLGLAPSGLPRVFSRRLDGSPAVVLGEGNPEALSPDGRWVLVRRQGTWALLPTGAGQVTTLEAGPPMALSTGGWVDSERIVFTGGMAGGPRIYIQDISGGPPRPLTPERVVLTRAGVTPDGTAVLGVPLGAGRWNLYPIDGGSPQATSGFRAGDQTLRWSADGTSLFVRRAVSSQAVDVVVVDVRTGERQPWKTLTPGDPVGVDGMTGVSVTPDGSAYCYGTRRRLGSLFVAEGLIAQ